MFTVIVTGGFEVEGMEVVGVAGVDEMAVVAVVVVA